MLLGRQAVFLKIALKTSPHLRGRDRKGNRRQADARKCGPRKPCGVTGITAKAGAGAESERQNPLPPSYRQERSRAMKLAIRLAIVLLCLLAPVAVAAQTAEVDWVHGTDFSRFHSFTWATGAYPIQDPDANLGMAAAVQDELGSKGVQYVGPQDKFDLFVTYNAVINPDAQGTARKIITIKVRIFDARNNTRIWIAGGYVALVDDLQENRRNVRALLAEMFRQYPPSE